MLTAKDKTKFIIFLFVATFFITSQIKAADEFKTEYVITYKAGDNNETEVFQDISLTNLKDDVIATNYTLSIKQLQIYDILAKDGFGEMEINTQKDGLSTVISTEFNENIIGKGRTNKFLFQYKTKDLVNKVGEIYNIKIPKVAGLDTVRSYEVNLVVPKSFGPKIFITPLPTNVKEEQNKFVYSFDKASLLDKGISASFGKYQVLNYKLIYQLRNKGALTNIQEIALPPDIKERQQISHKDLSPRPLGVYEDEDGNLIAQYKLKPKQMLEVTLIGSVRIVGKQINPELGGLIEDIPENISEKYTKERKYWEVSALEVQTLKNKLFDEELNIPKNAQKIYEYIIQNLEYDFGMIEKEYVQRHGAVETIKNGIPTTCMGFTDLFIAIARAMGIPARELDGYAINTHESATLPLSIKLKGGDLLHAWPEYYDPNFGWLPVDPTWGNTSKLDFFTKLDNNHFVFVIKGTNSEFPLPAGLHRYDDSKRLVSVEISQDNEENEFTHYLTTYKKMNLNPINMLRGINNYLISNEGGTYIYNLHNEKVLPFEVKSINIHKKMDKMEYEDINGEVITQNFVFIDKNPNKYLISPWAISISLALGLAAFSRYS